MDKKLKEAFAFLSITGKYKVIGTGATSKIHYKNDYDIQELFEEPVLDDFPNKIYHLFLKKFKDGEKKPNYFITDFKCGEVNGTPIRWNKYTIRDGFQMIGSKSITFQECLLQKSTIKMDLIVIGKDSTITEISENYYFKLGKYSNFKKTSKKDTLYKLKEDILELREDGHFLKVIKRLRSFLSILKKEKLIEPIIKFLNSEVGLLGKIVSDLKTLQLLLEQNYKVPKEKDIFANQQRLKKMIHSLTIFQFKPLTYKNIDRVLDSRDITIHELETLIIYLQAIANRDAFVFLEQNKQYRPYIH